MNQSIEHFKQQAAKTAVDFVQSGMVVGLGHGSTAGFAVRRIAGMIDIGQLTDLLCVPCSKATETLASELGITLTTLDEHPNLDLTIDGADEVDPELNLIKGGGGALLREKMVAQASQREIIVVDESKLSPALGTRFTLPIEVVQFGWRAQLTFLESLGGKATLRLASNGEPFRTDQGNLIVDCDFGPIADPHSLAGKLEGRAGIVEHGLFLGLATDIIVVGSSGTRHLKRKDS